MRNVAYRRVSTNTGKQKTERQLYNTGIVFDLEFEDHSTGTNTKQRPNLQRCLDVLESGDMLYIHSIDRLARNTADLLRITQTLLDRGVGIKFVKEGLSVGSDEDPMAKAMGAMLLSVLGAVHTFQATMIQESVKEGIRVAKDAGKLKKGKDSKWYQTFTKNKANHKTTRNSEATKAVMQPVVEKVKQIIAYSNDSVMMKDIAAILNNEGLRTARGKEFSTAHVSTLIKNNNITYSKKTNK